ncbi:hypothetical protein MMC30_009017 [Trapelia coarctata]|nr:hypothetical protein [Trapelia coarctata]
MGLIWNGYYYFTTYKSADVRNVATAIFWILTTLITLTGTLLLNRRNRYMLLRGKDFIPINHLSTWMSQWNAVTYWWQTKRLPGGRYGILMLFTGALALLGQFLIGRYIITVQQPGYCNFTSGVVVPPTSPGFNPIVPPAQWPAAAIAWNAQQTSILNGGLQGIYKIASLDTNFSATELDSYGSWYCDPFLPDRTYSLNTTAVSIATDLVKANSIFPNPIYNNSQSYDLTTNRLDGLLIWSASTPDGRTQLWNVTASYAATFNYTTDQITMHTMNCSMTAPDIPWALGLIRVNDTLDQWGEKAYGLIQSPSTVAAYYEDVIAGTLNSIVMSAAGGNQVLESLPSNETDGTYGCLVPTTLILSPIFAALGVLTLVVVLMALTTLIFILLTWSLPPHRKAKVEAIPADLVSWQVAGMRDVFRDEKIAAGDMPSYTFGWLRDGEMVGYRKPGSDDDHGYRKHSLPLSSKLGGSTYTPVLNPESGTQQEKGRTAIIGTQQV